LYFLVIFTDRVYKNKEFVFYCLYLNEEGATKLGIVHDTKNQMYLALFLLSQYIDEDYFWQSEQ
jgi:hypothetical protein